MFRHILCPTDLKERATVAFAKAAEIAHQFGSKITLLNVHEEFMGHEERAMLRVSAEKMKDKFTQIAVESKKNMQAIVQQQQAQDIDVDYLLVGGKPPKAIVEVANNLGVDLIVICTDGRDNLLDCVTCTVTEHVVSSAHCPVLVVPYKR